MSQLTEFLREKKLQATRPEAEWERKKVDWLESVQRLYDLIRTLLKEPLDQNLIDLEERPVHIVEQEVGAYELSELELKVGNDRVKFVPKGVNVIGAEGRVDMRGRRETVTLVRLSDSPEAEWHVILQRVPKKTIVPLDETSLKLALERALL